MNSLVRFQSFERIGTFLFQNSTPQNYVERPEFQNGFKSNKSALAQMESGNTKILIYREKTTKELITGTKYIETEKEKKGVDKNDMLKLSKNRIKSLLIFAKKGDLQKGMNFAAFQKKELEYEYDSQSNLEDVTQWLGSWVDNVADSEIEDMEGSVLLRKYQESIWILQSKENLTEAEKQSHEDIKNRFFQKYFSNFSNENKVVFNNLLAKEVEFKMLSQDKSVIEHLNKVDKTVPLSKASDDLFKVIEKNGSKELKTFVNKQAEEISLKHNTIRSHQQLTSFRKSIEATTNSEEQAVAAIQVVNALNTSVLGGDMRIGNIKYVGEECQIFFNTSSSADIGNKSYMLGITRGGETYIRNDYDEDISFEPENPKGLESCCKIHNYSQIAREASQDSAEWDNFSQFMSPNMILKFLTLFETYNRSSMNSEKLFFRMCKGLVDKEPADTIGLGKYFRQEFFGNGAYLDRDKLLAIETETIQKLGEVPSTGPVQELLA